uniref:Uncharacterized protein n=1 Tax=viral metagenome TaxID=1070528 RepID=A0A6C0JKY6_9ZZZZ
MALIARKPYVKINIVKYPTTFFYEKMRILNDDFSNDLTNKFFKEIVAEKIAIPLPSTIKEKDIVDKIKVLLEKVHNGEDEEKSETKSQTTNATTNATKSETKSETNATKSETKKAKRNNYIGVDCIKIIGDHILQYNIKKLWFNNTNTIFLFPIISTSNDHGEKLLLSQQVKLYNEILQKNGIFGKDVCTGNGKDSTLPVKKDNDKPNGLGNTLEFLNLISEDDEDIESFKSRLTKNLELIEQKIKDRENDDNLERIGPCKQFQNIIFFVNKINGEEDPIFFKYYKKGLKKEFVAVLKEQLSKFFNSRKFGNQETSFNNTLPDANNIEKLTKDSIISKLKKPEYGEYDQKDINDDIDNIQLLLEKFKMFYKRETDETFKKSITSSDNSDIFNIFMRFNNLDTPAITDEIIANRDTLYMFKEMGKKPKIGFFYVSNLERHQYIFNLDLIENKKYKDSNPDTIKNSNSGKKDKKQEKSQDDQDEKQDDDNAADLEESLIINPLLEIKDSTRKTLVEVKLEFGKLIFRNIQKNIRQNYEPENEIIYYGQRKSYDYYRWFNHRMIDTSLTDNINIRFFKDTIYDVKSLKAYLNSENKLLKDTRIALEFLKINSSPEILKYNDFIFNNFKGNINPHLYLTQADNFLFEETIKKGIVDILFEKNSLVYIKDTKQVSEKEKEGSTKDNYKIIKYKYVPILGKEPVNKLEIIYKHFKEKVTTSVDELEFNYYKNPNNLKSYIDEKNKLSNPPITTNSKVKLDKTDKVIPPELLTQLVNIKKTLGMLIVDVSKDVFSNPVSLYLAAECKTRSKRLKDTYYNIKKYFKGGTNKKKRKMTRKRKIQNKYKNKRFIHKSRRRPILRRI